MSKHNISRSQSALLIATIAIIAVVVGVISYQQTSTKPLSEIELNKIIVLDNPKVLAPFQLIDHKGQTFSSQQMLGYWNIVFFGFTHCPDICPTTLQTLAQVKESLASKNKWGNYRVILVTVDPQRDNSEKLASYLPFFDPEFIGLTGEEESIRAFAKQLGILFVKNQDQDTQNYQVDHSTAVAVLDPSGRMAGVIPAPHHAPEISADLATLAEHFADDHLNRVSQIANDSPIQSITSAKEVMTESSASLGSSPPSLLIEDGWVRAMPATSDRLAAYFTLHNTSDSDIRIVDSSSELFDTTMIHDTLHKDGIAKMHHLNELIIPARQKVILAPLGKHMMLIDPDQPILTNQQIEITLISQDGHRYSSQLLVR